MSSHMLQIMKRSVDCFLTELISVFRGGTVSTFFKATAESGQIVKTGLKCNIRYGNIHSEHGLGGLYPFVAQVIVKGCIGMLLK